MYQSIPSLTIPPPPPPPNDPREFAHSCYPSGRVFAPLSCPAGGGGGLKSKQKFDNFEKSAISALSLKQLSISSFDMFIYARIEQPNTIPNYTITNTERIWNYPGWRMKDEGWRMKDEDSLNWDSSWSKFHPLQYKENQTLFTSLTTEILSRLPSSHEGKYGEYSDLFSYG